MFSLIAARSRTPQRSVPTIVFHYSMFGVGRSVFGVRLLNVERWALNVERWLPWPPNSNLTLRSPSCPSSWNESGAAESSSHALGNNYPRTNESVSRGKLSIVRKRRAWLRMLRSRIKRFTNSGASIDKKSSVMFPPRLASHC